MALYLDRATARLEEAVSAYRDGKVDIGPLALPQPRQQIAAIPDQ
jgi:hypothetical protein